MLIMQTQSAEPDAGVVGQQLGMNDQMIDLAAAADELGVTEEALQAVLGEPGQGPPDFAAAAADELGVTEETLIEALDLCTGMPPMTIVMGRFSGVQSMVFIKTGPCIETLS